jgi:hypothetical protein
MIYFILGSYVKMKIQISHTVVNLSSHQLTENEISLLSRDLSFCPLPGPINETKLSEELDNFARNHRIKEHCGSKEVEGGDASALIVTQKTHVTIDLSIKVDGSRNLVRTSLWKHL